MSLLQHDHQHVASLNDGHAMSWEKCRMGTMAMRLYWSARMRAALCMQVSRERVNHSSTHFTCSFHMRAASPCCKPSSGACLMGTACTCTHLTSYPLLPSSVVREHACSWLCGLKDCDSKQRLHDSRQKLKGVHLECKQAVMLGACFIFRNCLVSRKLRLHTKCAVTCSDVCRVYCHH